ncbi:cytosolic protein [Aliivibrio sp. S4TY2]|uniref:cytosolic protein n=1 Tax=unclassified Aliivibrio TaxID=2645654 RepID=UPI002378C38C|nr:MULTISPECIES: cytosolic protein [unclassified Aliivibrio]MDD9157616.1 cytosolic protein [Aliivibrio sp. S4TY2]MDD9161421.1 cytosolic protein [Aliivibrio sp. S4TY1]MDD9165526.1 cytosolic protein [Aliivibrio sp. S4MY2]MDD9169450.1 cytosolic protein [Aliivibrio sp. S4MY4]MDD9186443.1 cytosolic protein [Aliivibrio sp. S4MY3]
MKLLYWLDEWLTNSHPEQQARLPMTGSDLLDDVFVKYEFIDLDKPLLFTFSPAGTNLKEQDLHDDFAPWGYLLAQKQDVNIIAFQHLGQSNWFRNRNLIFFLEQLSTLLEPFKNRLGYGLSRGGFAVGAFADVLQLDQVLLFHPVSTKNQNIAPWDDRSSTEIAQQFDWEGDYHDLNLGKAKGYIIYDPTNRIDRLHAKRYPELTHLRVFGMGHGTHATYLNKFGFYKQVAVDFMRHQQIDIAQFRQQTKTLRFKEDYYKRLNKANSSSEHRLGLLSKAHNIVLGEKEAHVQEHQAQIDVQPLIDIAMKHQDEHPQDAIQLLEMAQLLVPDDPMVEHKLRQLA